MAFVVSDFSRVRGAMLMRGGFYERVLVWCNGGFYECCSPRGIRPGLSTNATSNHNVHRFVACRLLLFLGGSLHGVARRSLVCPGLACVAVLFQVCADDACSEAHPRPEDLAQGPQDAEHLPHSFEGG